MICTASPPELGCSICHRIHPVIPLNILAILSNLLAEAPQNGDGLNHGLTIIDVHYRQMTCTRTEAGGGVRHNRFHAQCAAPNNLFSLVVGGGQAGVVIKMCDSPYIHCLLGTEHIHGQTKSEPWDAKSTSVLVSNTLARSQQAADVWAACLCVIHR